MTRDPVAHLALILHAHLPFVRHCDRADVMEESWLAHALVECYLPLHDTIAGWARDGVPFGLALSLSPTLIAMLDDPLLRERVERRVEGSIALAEDELRRAREPALRALAEFHRGRFASALQRYRALDRDLVEGFARLAHDGRLELFTTSATHAFLPNLLGLDAAIEAQLALGLDHHRRRFGAPARGFWLPECGFAPGLDVSLAGLGVRWFVVETHALTAADPPAVRGPYAPLFCPSGVAALARDPACSRAVWSADQGYPGDALYRDFHRDLGNARDVRPFLEPGTPDGRGLRTGIKYHAVTDRTSDEKRLYEPVAAHERASLHAQDFVTRCLANGEALADPLGAVPLFVAPFDAELFGHWWFEGPTFLDAVVRAASRTEGRLALITPSRYLAVHSTHQVAIPAASSWGAGGHAGAWIDPRNAWAVREVRDVAEALGRLARSAVPATGLAARALAQAKREALLAMASDWSFVLRAGTVPSYAERRIRDHAARFRHLARALEDGRFDEPWLAAVEAEDNLFPDLGDGGRSVP